MIKLVVIFSSLSLLYHLVVYQRSILIIDRLFLHSINDKYLLHVNYFFFDKVFFIHIVDKLLIYLFMLTFYYWSRLFFSFFFFMSINNNSSMFGNYSYVYIFMFIIDRPFLPLSTIDVYGWIYIMSIVGYIYIKRRL